MAVVRPPVRRPNKLLAAESHPAKPAMERTRLDREDPLEVIHHRLAARQEVEVGAAPLRRRHRQSPRTTRTIPATTRFTSGAGLGTFLSGLSGGASTRRT